MMHPKDIALAPIYLYQANKLKRTALSLPEAGGERHGVTKLDGNSSDTLRLLMAGDSSAAGVGVEHQQDALLGHLLANLQQSDYIQTTFSEIDWALHATTGHTSFDILRRLYVLPSTPKPIDIMLVLMGVNDTTNNVSLDTWRKQIKEIITLSQRKFGAKHIIFPYLPPMAHMPSIPAPLSTFIGAKSDMMNENLQVVIDEFANISSSNLDSDNTPDETNTVTTVTIDFAEMGKTAEELFSEDGFHPNSIAYEFWAGTLAKHIETLLKGDAVER